MREPENSQAPAFVHRIRYVRPAVTGHAARSRELAEHKPQTVFIVRDLRVNLGVGAFQIGAGIERWSSVPGPEM